MKVMNQEIISDKIFSVGSRMANEYITKGDYYPTESWGCEGNIYPPLTGMALLGLYNSSNDRIFLDGVYCIIKSIIAKQLASGAWPLSLGVTGNGMKFKVSDYLMKLTSDSEDLPPTVVSLRLIAEFKDITGDTSFDDSLNKGFEYLQQFWDEENRNFKEMLSGEGLKLRASPSDYNIFTYLCILSLKKVFPVAEKYEAPLYKTIKKNFEQMSSETYPLLYGMHAALISKIEGPSNYVKTFVKSKLYGELGFDSMFKIENHPGAIGHKDGVRGICIYEGHLRNSVGIAMAMSFYDYYTNSKIFTNSNFYNDLIKWIESMYFESKFYEFLDINSGKKFGFGSSGQYLPIFLALRSF